MAALVVDRLQPHVLTEPNESFHDACRLSELFAATPATLAEAPLHVLSLDEVLIDTNEKLSCLDQFRDDIAVLFVFNVCQRTFLDLRDFYALVSCGDLA